MSRRKQAKPRALKRELEDEGEDPDNTVSMATEAGKDLPSVSCGSDVERDVATPASSDAPVSSVTTGEGGEESVASNSVAMDTGVEEDVVTGLMTEIELYRCETCDATFHSLTEFMDHRNFECITDGDLSWELGGMSPMSRSSSPFSGDPAKSPMADSPCSPSVIDIPVHQIPYIVGANEGHPYACQFCEKAFARLSFLKKHEQVHADQMPYKCEFCHRLFKHKRSRDRHVKLHTGDKKYKCRQCDAAFSRSDHLKIHLKTHDNDKPHQCEMCNRGYTTAAALTSHMLTHKKVAPPLGTTPKELPCPQCGEKYTILADLQLHLQVHMVEQGALQSPLPREKALPCPYCGEVCLGRDALELHFDQSHAKEKFKCPACNAGYPTIDDLLTHLKTQHDYPGDETEMPEITIAPIKMDSEDEVSLHQQDLQAVMKFDCPYCDKGNFSSMDVLEIHVRTLHQDRLGQVNLCQYCNTMYPSTAELEEHLKSQHAANGLALSVKFPCDYCTLEFSSEESLQLHKENVHRYSDMMTRSPEVVFCSMCTMRFPNSFALSEHIHNVHGMNLSTKSTSSSPMPRKEGSDRGSKTSNCGTPSSFTHSHSPRPLRPHSNTSSAGESWTCDQCNATFMDPKSYQVHMKSHIDSSLSKYCCSECQAEFPTEDQLESHIFVHFLALTTEYGCTSCLKLFSKPDELQKHLMDIHAHHLYRCSLCKEIFDSKVNIQVHFAIKHSNECKLYKCTTCGSVFRSEMEWQLHVKVHHLGISKPYRCLFCKDSFGTEVELQCHLTTHKKQFTCPLCDEAFHVEYLLDKHMQTKHSPENQQSTPNPKVKVEKVEPEAVLDYSTPTPGASSSKSVTQLSPVSSHSSNHNSSLLSPIPQTSNPATPPMITRPPTPVPKKGGDLTFKCDICDVKFCDESTLQKHRMHDHSISPEMSLMMQKAQQAAKNQATVKPGQTTGPDKFSQLCVYCNQTFKTKSELEKHMKTHVTPSNQKCNICDEIFPSASILAEHKLQHCKVVKGNVCVICKMSMKNEEQFYAHAQQHGFQGTTMQCIVCRQTLASMLELQMHGKHHFQSPTNFYTCCVCLKSFDSKENLVSKLNSNGRSYYVCKPCYHGENSTEKPQPCPTCGAKFETKMQLDNHMLQHKKTYQCIKCQQSFATEYEIQVHVATHVMQEGNIHECRICDQRFDSPAKLQCHLIEHTFNEAGEIRCYICDVLFTHPSGIQMHVLEHGMGARRYACTQCPQRFFFSAELQNHMYVHVSGMPGAPVPPPISSPTQDLQCPECSQLFPTLAKLTSHRKTHSQPSPNLASNPKKDLQYKCSLCTEAYSCMSQLQQHFFVTHADAETEKPKKKYGCSRCSKEFVSLNNLQAHMKLHNSGKENSVSRAKSPQFHKPVPCPICGKMFAKKSNVKEHMKIHFVQASIFSCDLCSETFSQSQQLERHLVAVHNKEHACEVCREVFGQARQLRIHVAKAHGIKDLNSSGLSKDIVNDQSSMSGSSTIMDWESEQLAAEVLEASKISVVHNGSNRHSLDTDIHAMDMTNTTSAADTAKQKLLAAKLEGVTVVANPSEQVTVS